MNYFYKLVAATLCPLAMAVFLLLLQCVSKVFEVRRNHRKADLMITTYPLPTEHALNFDEHEIKLMKKVFHLCDPASTGVAKKGELIEMVKEMDRVASVAKTEIKINDEACLIFGEAMHNADVEVDFGQFLTLIHRERAHAAHDSDASEAFQRMMSNIEAYSVSSGGGNIFNIFLLLTFLVLTATSKVIFNLFKCDEMKIPTVDGGKKQSYLFMDYSVSCYSKNYQYFTYYAWGMIMIYPIGSE